MTNRSFTPSELLALLKSSETSFVERKTFSDQKDWVPAIAAFANSRRYDDAGVLFIGVYNDGTIQEMQQKQNLEKLQITVTELLRGAFPPINVDYKTVTEGDRECLAVIVFGSPRRPHFVGSCYVRVGPQTVKASEGQFDDLVHQRNEKTYRILLHKGEKVTVERVYGRGLRSSTYEFEAVVEDCNSQWVTLRSGTDLNSLSLETILPSWDHSRERLKLVVRSD